MKRWGGEQYFWNEKLVQRKGDICFKTEYSKVNTRVNIKSSLLSFAVIYSFQDSCFQSSNAAGRIALDQSKMTLRGRPGRYVRLTVFDGHRRDSRVKLTPLVFVLQSDAEYILSIRFQIVPAGDDRRRRHL